LQKPLYKHDYIEPQYHRSNIQDYFHLTKRINGFIYSFREIISLMPIPENDKTRLYAVSEINHLIRLVINSLNSSYRTQDINKATGRLLEKVNFHFTINSNYDTNSFFSNPREFCAALMSNILQEKPPVINTSFKRIIAWGASGKNAKRLLPLLKGTFLEPCELWDITGCNRYVKKPDIASLTTDDIILILPSDYNAVTEINKSLSGKKSHIIQYESIINHISTLLYPDFFNGIVSFSPKYN